MEPSMTGPTRLLRAHPDLAGHISKLGERYKSAMLDIPETLDRLRATAGITDPRSSTSRALDSACVLGYAAAVSDTVLALSRLVEAGSLPATARGLRKLAGALDGSTVEVMLHVMDAASKAGEEAVEALLRRLLKTVRVD